METVEVPRILPNPVYAGPGIAEWPDTVLSPEQVPVMPAGPDNENSSGGSGFWGSPYQTMELPRLTLNPEYATSDDAFLGDYNMLDDWFGEGASEIVATIGAGAAGFFFPVFWTGYNLGNWLGWVPAVSGPVLLGSSIGVAGRGVYNLTSGGSNILDNIRKNIERTSYGLYGAGIGAAAAAARASRYGFWPAIAGALVGAYVGYSGGTGTYDFFTNDAIEKSIEWWGLNWLPGGVP